MCQVQLLVPFQRLRRVGEQRLILILKWLICLLKKCSTYFCTYSEAANIRRDINANLLSWVFFFFVIWCFFLLLQFSFSEENLIWMYSKSCSSAARHTSNYLRRVILPGKLWWRHRHRHLALSGSLSRAFGTYKLVYHHYPAVNNLCLFILPESGSYTDTDADKYDYVMSDFLAKARLTRVSYLAERAKIEDL